MIFQFIIILAALSFTRYIIQRQTIFKENVLWTVFILKIVFSISLGLVYIFYYEGGDTLSFHQDAHNFSSYLKAYPNHFFDIYFNTASIPLLEEHLIYSSNEPRALFFSKVLSFIYLFTNSSYWISSAFVACLGFWCSLALLFELQKVKVNLVLPVFFAILLYPSTLFWTSGLLKESLMMISIFGLTYSFLNLYRKKRIEIITAFTFLLSVLMLFFLKYYILGLLVAFVFPSCFVVLLVRFNLLKQKFLTPLWLILTLIFLFGGTFLHPNLSFHSFLDVLVRNHNLTLSLNNTAEGIIVFHDLEPTVMSLIANSPKALISGLFRPFPWEVYSYTAIMASLENVVLLFLLLTSILKVKKIELTYMNLITLSALIYIFASCILLSISTPNLGSLSRYKVAFSPFLLTLILSSSWFRSKMERFEKTIIVK
ncbi:MAG: hypothetical protein AAF363_09910 [Bacteroidota bacterium]